MRTTFGTIRKEDTNYKRFKKNKLFYRNRGISELQVRFDENILEITKQLCNSKQRVNVLEIGFGEGKALSEFGALDKKIFCYGINDVKKPTLSNVKDLLKNSKNFGLKLYNNPKIYFYDAGNVLKFKNNYFDIIYSQVAIHYVGNKAKLLEEVWRVLKVGGYAFLHIDSGLQGKQPEFMRVYKDTPRMIIYDSSKRLISTKGYLRKFRESGFDIKINFRTDERKNINIVIHKNTDKLLNLSLDFDGNSSINLGRLRDSDTHKFDTSIWWSTRSVFKIRKDA